MSHSVSTADITPDASVSRSETHAHSILVSTPETHPPPVEVPPTSNIHTERMAKPTRQRPAEDAPEQPLAKKTRRQPDDEKRKANSPSSPSSSSQGKPESEMDADRSQQSEASLSPAAPPKKKRTRTLTTPHQSAVLHALLAQSRFPTTAMREEVGRSIGLSARKVQIWFQNQRQKARRPSNQSQSSALLTRPAQYGSFPGVQVSPLTITTAGGHGVGSSSRGPNAATSSTPDESALKCRRYDAADSHLDRGSQLLGPGMPGVDIVSASPFRGRELPLPTRTTSERIHHYMPSAIPHSAPLAPGRPSSAYITPRPSSAHISGGTLHHRSFSRTLPPLVFDGPRPRTSYSAPGPGLYSLSPAVPAVVSRNIKHLPSPESPFAHTMPDPTPRLHPVVPMHFSRPPPPPPKALLRSHSSLRLSPPVHVGPISWSGRTAFHSPSSPALITTVLTSHTRPPSSSRVGSISPGSHEVQTPASRTEELEAASPPSARLGRYDPVRATFVPIRQLTPPPTTCSPSPTAQSIGTYDSPPPESGRPRGVD